MIQILRRTNSYFSPLLCAAACPSTTSTARLHVSAATCGNQPDPSRPKTLSQHRAGTNDFTTKKFIGERMIDQDMRNDEDQMMTLETHKQMFYGLPYEDIPICHIKASKNNTLISFTTPMGEAITSTSCRREGFKNARKKTEVAAQTTGLAAGVRALRRGLMTVRVRLQGIGPGRVAAPKGLALSGINIVSITDCTLATEIGPRPKNVRRV